MMKISKNELIEMDACEYLLRRFINQTNGTERAVKIDKLVGGECTYADLLWIAKYKLPKDSITRFVCDCALISIEKIKPYTDKYDLIMDFLTDPTETKRGNVHTAAYDAIGCATTRIAANAAYVVSCAAERDAYYSAHNAAERAVIASGNREEVNNLLRKLFSVGRNGKH